MKPNSKKTAEMVTEAGAYEQQAFTSASQRLASVITRTGGNNLIVFNPLPYQRADIVHADIPPNLIPVDASTGAKVPVQQLPDGSTIFVAENVPATGYKTYQLIEGTRSVVAADTTILESKFYRIQFNRTTGALTSLFDKDAWHRVGRDQCAARVQRVSL